MVPVPFTPGGRDVVDLEPLVYREAPRRPVPWNRTLGRQPRYSDDSRGIT
jgi:hypothetical protein